MDMVYCPFKTRLLKEAAIQGARTIEGLHMLAHQAALSFELWTGRQISADFMLEKGLGALLAW
jgi:shikimate dehydrogenase